MSKKAPGWKTLLCISCCFMGLSGVPCVWSEDRPVAVSSQELESSIDLKMREDALAAREKNLKLREKELVLLQNDVNTKLEQISTMQKDVAAKLAEIKQEQDLSFKNLIKVYSAMSATKLAPLFNQMTDKNVARILRSMKADQVAQVIPKLDSEKAVRVSRLLGRFQ